MKLIEAMRYRGDPFWIPDCTRDELPEFFKSLGFRTGVEIGVQYGDNLEGYCKAGLMMYGVDPWVRESSHNRALKRLSHYSNCTLIRKTSMDALADFSKRSLDFVYIDGNHKFGFVANDLMYWSDKIRKGGVISGHDYYCPKGDRKNRQVGYVVDAFTKGCDIDNWYVLGRKMPIEAEKADDTFSYMFFKHW